MEQNLPDPICMEMEKPRIAVPAYSVSRTQPPVATRRRELAKHLKKKKYFPAT